MIIGIVGLGLMGGTFAKALKRLGHTIYGYDQSTDAIRYAFEHRMIDSGSTRASDVLPSSDLVILCLYPNDIVQFVKENMDLFKFAAVLTDIAGIKTTLTTEILPVLRVDLEFVFGHPIAGREKKGIQYSDTDIFNGANYVFTPTEHNKVETIFWLSELMKSIGFRNVTCISPKKHDDIIAFTSQLTHVLALSLANNHPSDVDLSKFIGDSYRDLTRIAMINDALWAELFLLNKDSLLTHMENIRNTLLAYEDAIRSNDTDCLRQRMKDAAHKRKNL